MALDARNVISGALRTVLIPVVILLPAGRWDWWEAWVMTGLYLGYAACVSVMLVRRDPELLKERMKGNPVQTGQPFWDRAVMIGMLVVGFAMFPVPGLDVVRFGWSERLPVAWEVVALGLHVPCFAWIGWVMYTNTFLARVVKIDEARGHHVITTGPYAFVRHPMYVAVIALVALFPIALGSRWGLVPAGLMAALLVVRTAFEDRMLHTELEGYPEYAAQTRYRLLPGVW